MERPLHDTSLTIQAATVKASKSSSARGPARLFAASSARDRALSANRGLASFPHEEVEFTRAYSNPSNALHLVAGATPASSPTIGTASLQSVPLPRWSASPLTPRNLTATIHHPPPPLGMLLTSPTAGTGSSSAEVVGNEVGSHFYHYSNGYSADTSTKTTVPETARRHETELTGIGRSPGVWSNVTALERSIGDIPMTMSTTMATLPLPLARPLAIPSPPAPVVIANSISATPTRKRKRIIGAMRMRNFLCMHPGCDKSFADSAHLRDHTVVHTGEKKLSCSICQKLFARASTLQEHIRVHTGEKPYVCIHPGCTKRYSSRAAMRFHRTTHTPFFTAEQGLDGSIHVETDTDSVQVRNSHTSRYVCSECGKHFRVRELLVAHLKIHATHRAAVFTSLAPSGSVETVIDQPQSMEEETSENSSQSIGIPPPDGSIYFWDTIRAQQNQIEQLKAEILRLRGQTSIESAATPVQTEVAVSNQPALTAPVEMLQDGCKPFVCCICNNRFSNFYQLTFHGKQHPAAPMAEVTGKQAPLPVGPKYCPEEQCEYAESTGKSLKNLQTLKRHWQRRHQSERPYACSYCPATRQKTFKTRENLKAHEKDCTKNILGQ
ncbi:unnamed protein product [Peronospora effusa]|nr:unnamed protein product [Peronospora effusa]